MHHIVATQIAAMHITEFAHRALQSISPIFLGEGGCAKGVARWACGETAVQTSRKGQQEVVNQNRQPGSQERLTLTGLKPPVLPDSVC